MKRILVSLLLPLACAVHADAPDSYSMVQVTTAPDGKEEATSKWYVTPTKTRTESSAMTAGPMGGMIIIAHKDEGVVWTIFPSKKAYMERPLDEEGLGDFQKTIQKNQQIEELGKDEILGYDCDKQKVSNKIEIGPRTVDMEQTIWKCGGFDFPLRIEGSEGQVTETKELTPGPQPDELFEAPEGFRKAANMMELMGGMKR